jgi:steroid 5-alpha reductase family enzyme
LTGRDFFYLAAMNEKIRNSRPAGFLVSACAYVAAFFIAAGTIRFLNPCHPLAAIAAADLAATVFIFLLSVAFNNSSIYDPYWSVKPIVIACYYYFSFPNDGWGREILVLALVFLYSLRLTSNFYRDWPGLSKEDFRYVNFRNRFPKGYWGISFLAVHLFPTIMVYLACMPMFAVFTSVPSSLNILDLAGAVIMIGAVVYAFVADEQLRIFRKDPAHSGTTITTGLWGLSRHPNYLGEISTWWGLYFFALASGSQWWWTGAGALAITVLFIFASIPLMEERMIATRTDYSGYRKRVPALFPKIINKR